MSKHSPGPWRNVGDFIHDSSNLPFAVAYTPCNDGMDNHEERKANANLMATAPELLEALKSVVEAMNGSWPERVAVAHAAIAKAENRTEGED